MNERRGRGRVRGRGPKLVEVFCLALALALALALPASAQRPVWVYLQPDALRDAPVVIGTRARPAFPNDRAIPRSLLKRIEATGAHVRTTSRWLQAFSVDADAAALSKIATIRGVRALVPVREMTAAAPDHSDAPIDASSLQPFNPSTLAIDYDSAFYGHNWQAIKLLGIPASHTLNFTGKGVKIALLDTGFEPAHDALKTRVVLAQRDFINNDNNVANQPGDIASSADQEVHGTWTWSVLGGYAPGQLVGPAFDANFILAKTELNQLGNADYKADEDRWVAAIEWADSNGARVVSSSLAYRDFVDAPSYPVSALNGNTTAVARAADEAARRGILVVNAMGNFGPNPSTLWSPADADSVIAVGAIDARTGVIWESSSRGPTADGRLKPELVAPGVSIFGANSQSLSSYNAATGTSLATPFVAGIAAMFMEAWPNLTIMAVRRALILSASRADNPDNTYGYGVPDISSAILFPEGLTASAVYPRTPENVLTTVAPSFTWSAPIVNQRMRPVHYRVEVSNDPSFSSIAFSDTTDLFSLTAKRPLKPGTYYWRVTASAFPSITRSAKAALPFTMPEWVKLTSLNTSQPMFVDSVRPVFKWDPLEAAQPVGPLSFDVQILNASTGQIVQNLRNLTGTSVQPTDPLIPNISYKWRVIARTAMAVNGVQPADTVQSASTFTVRTETSPAVTLLYQNFPNPFPRRDLGETTTHVWFDVTTATKVELAIYDLRGRLVKQLIPNATSCGDITLQPGAYGRGSDSTPCVSTSWDGTNTSGSQVPRGVYILRLRAGGREEVKKILYTP